MDSYANKASWPPMAPHGPPHFMIFIFGLIHLKRLNWTQFIAVNYTDEPSVCTSLPFSEQYYTELLSTPMYCSALNCSVQHFPVLYPCLNCTVFHCTALHCTALHYTAMQCRVLTCSTLPCPCVHNVLSSLLWNKPAPSGLP